MTESAVTMTPSTKNFSALTCYYPLMTKTLTLLTRTLNVQRNLAKVGVKPSISTGSSLKSFTALCLSSMIFLGTMGNMHAQDRLATLGTTRLAATMSIYLMFASALREENEQQTRIVQKVLSSVQSLMSIFST